MPAAFASWRKHWSDEFTRDAAISAVTLWSSVTVRTSKNCRAESLFRQSTTASGHVGYQISVAVHQFCQVVPVFMGIVAARPAGIDGLVGIDPAARHPVDHRTEALGVQ